MTDYDSVRQRIAAFDKKNGGDGVEIKGLIYYSNGATRDAEPMGALMDPPTDAYERTGQQVSYWQELHRRAVEEFNDSRQLYLVNAKTSLNEAHCPPLPWTEAQAVQKLTELRDKIRVLQTRVKAARVEHKRNTPAHMVAQASNSSAARQAASSFVQAVEDIKI